MEEALEVVSERICYIHIGTHKTGSSAIQNFLMQNADALLERGIFVPRRAFKEDFLLGGHVNIARELLADPLYDESVENLDALLAVIMERQVPAVVITSELFELLHAFPEQLQRLAHGLEDIGYTPRIIAYIRPRPRYIQSLYAQMATNLFDCSFDEFLDAILRDGHFTAADGIRTFQFEYSKMLEPFVEVFGRDNIHLKVHGEKYGHAFPEDFLNIIDPAAWRMLADRLILDERVNESLSFLIILESLFEAAQAYANASGPTPQDLIAEYGGAEALCVHDTFNVLNMSDIARISARFATDNLRLATEYGVQLSLPGPMLTGVLAARRQREVLRAAATHWNLTNYRLRCKIRERQGMLPSKTVAAAAFM